MAGVAPGIGHLSLGAEWLPLGAEWFSVPTPLLASFGWVFWERRRVLGSLGVGACLIAFMHAAACAELRRGSGVLMIIWVIVWLLVNCSIASVFLVATWLQSDKASRSAQVPDHLRVASCLAIVRVVVGLNVAIFLFWKVQMRGLPSGFARDGQIFLVLAGLLCILAILRILLAAGGLKRWVWTRKLGVGLATFDCLNLFFFPVSTALGLQGFVAYRHSETVHHCRRQEECAPVR